MYVQTMINMRSKRYICFLLLVPENTQSQHGANKQSVEKGDIDSLRKHLNTSQVSHLPDRQEVEIWSKAAIG